MASWVFINLGRGMFPVTLYVMKTLLELRVLVQLHICLRCKKTSICQSREETTKQSKQLQTVAQSDALFVCMTN